MKGKQLLNRVMDLYDRVEQAELDKARLQSKVDSLHSDRDHERGLLAEANAERAALKATADNAIHYFDGTGVGCSVDDMSTLRSKVTAQSQILDALKAELSCYGGELVEKVKAIKASKRAAPTVEEMNRFFEACNAIHMWDLGVDLAGKKALIASVWGAP